MTVEAPGSLHWQFDPWKLNSAFIPTHAVSTSDGSTHPSYNSANSSALQAMAARGAHGRVVVNDTQSVINDTTNLSEGLPVINDTTNLSEELPVINDTSAKMTCVAYDLYGSPLNHCFDDLCVRRPVWLSFQSTLDDLYGRWPVWPMTCVINDLCDQ